MKLNNTNSTNFKAQFIDSELKKSLFKTQKIDNDTIKLLEELKTFYPKTKIDIVEFEHFNLEQTEHLNVIIKNLNNNIKNLNAL